MSAARTWRRLEGAVASRAPAPWRALNDLRLSLVSRFALDGARVRGAHGVPAVALTFDDGPDPAHTPRILAALARAEARGTFFMLGKHVEAHPELAREVAAHHEVGTHLYSHDRALCRDVGAFEDDLRRALDAHERALGSRPTLLRFPYGEPGRIRRDTLESHGLTSVHWSFSSHDSVAHSAHEVVEHVAARLYPGCFVLLHDGVGPGSTRGPGNREATVGAIPGVLEALAERGLAARPVGELIAPQAGGRT